MRRFSVGYNKKNPNFVIQNIEVCDDNLCKPIFAVLSNILQRGCPTIPSRFLREKFGSLKDIENEKFFYNLDFSKTSWKNVIKGGVDFRKRIKISNFMI